MEVEWNVNTNIQEDQLRQYNYEDLLNEDKSLDLYWLDAIEDSKNLPGCVLLFGKAMNKKTMKFESVCFKVENIQRSIYFAPRYQIQQSDSEQLGELDREIKEVLNRQIQQKDLPYRRKPIQKNYCFELDLPQN